MQLFNLTGSSGLASMPPNVVMSSDASLAGAVDGVNDTFTLPENASLVWVYVNGFTHEPGVAFNHAADLIIFQPGFIPQIGDKIVVYYLTAGAASPFVALSSNGTLVGTIDGVNDTFTLPSSASQAMVTVQSMLHEKPLQYTLAGPTITFQPGFIPQIGEKIIAYYWS